MYEKLTESLRKCGRLNMDDECICFHDGCCEAEPTCMYELMQKAADVIEELSRVADAIPHVCECCIGCEVETGGCDRAFVLSPKRAREYLNRLRWIPVTEHLPDKSRNYLTAFVDGTAMAVNEFMHPRDWLTEEGRKANPNGKWYWGGVTHWMPLPPAPEPPKENGKSET